MEEVENLIRSYVKKPRTTDDAYDLSWDIVDAVHRAEFPNVDLNDKIGIELRSAAEGYVGDLVEKLSHKSSLEKVERVTGKVLKRCRAFLGRIKETG